MRIAIFAVGRMKAGPEKELADRYFKRFARAAPAVGLEYAGLREIAESRRGDATGRRREESGLVADRLGAAALVVLDETGTNMGSQDFADALAGFRDAGRRDLALAIGGPDGHDPEMLEKADLKLAFGAATWPHQIVRVMLAEQLYRAATILAGHPYHRGRPAGS